MKKTLCACSRSFTVHVRLATFDFTLSSKLDGFHKNLNISFHFAFPARRPRQIHAPIFFTSVLFGPISTAQLLLTIIICMLAINPNNFRFFLRVLVTLYVVQYKQHKTQSYITENKRIGMNKGLRYMHAERPELLTNVVCVKNKSLYDFKTSFETKLCSKRRLHAIAVGKSCVVKIGLWEDPDSTAYSPLAVAELLLHLC